MSRTIQVRNVPERLHRELVKRAGARGRTLTDYIRDLLEREVARLPADDVSERLAKRAPVKLGMSAADLLRGGTGALSGDLIRTGGPNHFPVGERLLPAITRDNCGSVSTTSFSC